MGGYARTHWVQKRRHSISCRAPRNAPTGHVFAREKVYPSGAFFIITGQSIPTRSVRFQLQDHQKSNSNNQNLRPDLAELDVKTNIHTSSWKLCTRYLFLVAVALPFLVRCMNSSQIACTTQRCSRIPTVYFDHRIDEIPYEDATNSQYRTWPNTL